MMHFVYIIYSQKVDQYYIGETEDIENRLLKHNTGFFKNSFTAKTNDWKLFFSISCYNRTQAQKIEKHIKKNEKQEIHSKPEKTSQYFQKTAFKILKQFEPIPIAIGRGAKSHASFSVAFLLSSIMHFVYIIYSQKVDQYYIGETEDIENRDQFYNLGFYDFKNII